MGIFSHIYKGELNIVAARNTGMQSHYAALTLSKTCNYEWLYLDLLVKYGFSALATQISILFSLHRLTYLD